MGENPSKKILSELNFVGDHQMRITNLVIAQIQCSILGYRKMRMSLAFPNMVEENLRGLRIKR